LVLPETNRQVLAPSLAWHVGPSLAKIAIASAPGFPHFPATIIMKSRIAPPSIIAATAAGSRRRLRLMPFLIAIGLSPTALLLATPRHVYLTWQGDTSRTMTVNFQTFEPATTSVVYFDTQSRAGQPDQYRHRATGAAHQVPDLADGRYVHWVELRALEPGQTYYFIAGDPEHGFTKERRFRTVPAGREKLRFIVGGDMGVDATVPPLLQQAARLTPAFGVVGGDIAYANDMMTNYARWDAWLDHWDTNMVTPGGCTIPMVLAIGNHEIRRGASGYSPTNARFFFGYFAQSPERSYRVCTFGQNLALFLLDSGHAAPHDGDQATWLETQLAAHAEFPHRMAAYHVPLYPSHRAYDGSGSVQGRKAWLPLFDKYHLTTAFEHHDHSFKRTHLLRDNQVGTEGTLYLGDGCFGVKPRTVDQQPRWYLARAASLQHFWCVDVGPEAVEYRAVNAAGEVFDVYPDSTPGADAARKTFEKLTGS